MKEGYITMSQKEVSRLKILELLINKQIKQWEAANFLGLSIRQIKRLKKAYQCDGEKALVSKRRGKRSNNRLTETLKKNAAEIILKNYSDFGPTLAHEKLTEQHGLKLSVESVRQLMMKQGIWKGKKRRKTSIHPQRARRSCRGELIQIDGSPHDWFEGRGSRCCLLVFIDDATSELMQLYFAPEESTEAYFNATEMYLKQHGRPLAYYSDRHSIFRVNIPEAKTGTGETQFSRAMRELGIELICASSPQAKGRVEKANRTLQDRLVKEMRLKGISNIHTANAFLPEFLLDYNRRFTVSAANPQDVHRPCTMDSTQLNRIFSQQCQRKVSKNLELSYQNIIYQIESETPSYTLRGAYVTVCDRKGEVTLLYKKKILSYKIFDKQNRPTKIKDSKQISQTKKHPTYRPKANHPWRQYDERKQHKTQQNVCT